MYVLMDTGINDQDNNEIHKKLTILHNILYSKKLSRIKVFVVLIITK